MYIGYSYYYVLLPAILLTLYAQSKVKNTFNRYSSVRSRSGVTGAEAAQRLLHAAGIYDVRIEGVRGSLTDHYDPTSKVLRLSESVYGSTSLAAIGVAAHETGHAVQHARGYAPLKLRSMLVPATNIGSRLAMPIIFAGALLGGSSSNGLIQLGIMLFSLTVVFSLVTLPVEFNASSRAVDMLGECGVLDYEEIGPVEKVLNAAALTYVAAAASAIASLLRLLLIFGRRND